MFKNSLAIFGLVTAMAVSSTVVGQVDIPSPKFRPKSVETPENTRPFADPRVFNLDNYDAQVFAPLEFTNGKEADPQTGFFFTYERMYTSVSRPGGNDNITLNSVPVGSDYIWGNRYEIGYMSEEDNGWNIVFRSSEGSFFAAGQDILVAQPMLVETNFSDVGFNRIFRQNLSNGGYLEPYIGLRYISFSDNTLEDTTQFTTQTAFNRFRQNVKNDAVGLQAGARYTQRRGRFKFTGESAIATTYNQQRYFATDILTVGANTAVTEFYQSGQEFVPALDLRFELAYNVSRDIALRSGVQLTYMWDGLARANTLTTNLNPNSAFGIGGAAAGPPGLFDSEVIATGFTLGVEWRR